MRGFSGGAVYEGGSRRLCGHITHVDSPLQNDWLAYVGIGHTLSRRFERTL